MLPCPPLPPSSVRVEPVMLNELVFLMLSVPTVFGASRLTAPPAPELKLTNDAAPPGSVALSQFPPPVHVPPGAPVHDVPLGAVTPAQMVSTRTSSTSIPDGIATLPWRSSILLMLPM